MAVFNQSDYGYKSAMDRGYENVNPTYSMAPPLNETELGLSPKDIGISTPPFKDQLNELKARIFQGASRIELGFMGHGKGSLSQGNTTPEMFGSKERTDIKELARFNKITLSTHASPQAGSLAGFGQNRFDEHQREMALHEIERAVHFAADTTEGGAVVIHAQEYPRPISEHYQEEGFKMFPLEPQRAVLTLVDPRTGEIIPIRKSQDVYEPVYKTAKDMGVAGQKDPRTGRIIKDEDWIDMRGNAIFRDDPPEKLFERVPIWDPEKNNFSTVKRTWESGYFNKRAKDWNELHPDNPKTPEEMFYRIQLENQILQAKGASLFHGRYYEESRKLRDKLLKTLEYYEKLEENLPEEEKWKIKQTIRAQAYFVPDEVKDPVEYLKDRLVQEENQMRYIHEASAAADVQASQAQETLNRVKTIKDYAIDKSADTLARAALYAMEKSKKLKEPLYIAPENYFPETWGGHPGELKELILKGREKMVELLQSKVGKEEAEELATRHIKGTFDTGHAFTWWKYYEGNPKKSMEQNMDDFKKWYLNQVDDLVKAGVVGHIHVSDNFGWEDEHVVPGEGIAPIKEFMERIKKAGIKDVIVEPAHRDWRAMLGGWKTFGGSIYGLPVGRRENWADIEHSYFGQPAPPYFLYGESAPDPEHFTLWTGARME